MVERVAAFFWLLAFIGAGAMMQYIVADRHELTTRGPHWFALALQIAGTLVLWALLIALSVLL